MAFTKHLLHVRHQQEILGMCSPLTLFCEVKIDYSHVIRKYLVTRSSQIICPRSLRTLDLSSKVVSTTAYCIPSTLVIFFLWLLLGQTSIWQ